MNELFQYTFFQNALLGSLFASIACGIIGTYIVTRRLVFISGGITHASFGGVGIGLYTGLCSLLPSFLFFPHSVWNGSASGVTCVKTQPLLYSGLSVWL